MRTLWFVGGGVETIPGLVRAREMGCRIVVSDYNPDAPGMAYADIPIIASTYGIEETVEAARRFHDTDGPLTGVMSVATDVPLTVASVAEALDLPGIPVEAARLATNKLAMKERFVAEGVPTSWFSPVESVDHLRELVRERGFPLVIKPVDGRGARGVLLLREGMDPDEMYARSLSQSPGGQVMAEEFLDGPQVSTEAILFRGKGYTSGFSDRNYEYRDRFAPYFIENGGDQPSRLPEAACREIAATAEAAGRALGIETGVVKGDMVWSNGEARVIEVAARLSGGWFCTDQIPLGTGVDILGAAIRIALGEEPDTDALMPRRHDGVAIRYFFPEPGRIVSIEGEEECKALPWVHRMQVYAQPGEVLEMVTDHTRRAGFVITTGPDRETAVVRAKEIVDRIRITTEPVNG